MRPLQGMTVIDLTTNISGPTLTMILADLGANVIKIEKPTGDEARSMEPCVGEFGTYFQNINRGKKSVVLDLTCAKDKQHLQELIKTADVFVENFRLGKAQKLGFGYEDVKVLNEQLIYCSLTAYGQHGPKKDKPGYDAIIQAETGLMSMTGAEELARIPVSILDQGSALWGALGVVTALLQRQQHGIVQKVETSLYETGVFWSGYHLLSAQVTGENPQKLGSNHAAFAPYGAFQTLDIPLMVGISNDNLFHKFCTVIDQPQWLTDGRFSTNRARVENREILNANIQTLFAQETCDDLLTKLEQAGIPAARVNTILDVLNDPQTTSNNLIQQVTHPQHGAMKLTRLPITLSKQCLLPTESPPLLGEHTELVLDAIHRLKEQN